MNYDPTTSLPLTELATVNRKTGDPERAFTPGSEAKRFDIGGSVKYIGTNKPGVDEGSATWLITKYDFTDPNNIIVTVATDAIWTNRASESYT